MVMGRLMFRDLLCGGCMVEKYSKTELNDGFVKNVNFVKCGVVFVLFTEKLVVKLGDDVIFNSGFAENECKNVVFVEKMLFLHRVAICDKIANFRKLIKLKIYVVTFQNGGGCSQPPSSGGEDAGVTPIRVFWREGVWSCGDAQVFG
jgi:hypothetical protein